MNGLIYLAIFLFVAWLLLRLVMAVTGMLFNLLWILALVLLALWLWGKFFGKRS